LLKRSAGVCRVDRRFWGKSASSFLKFEMPSKTRA